MAVIEGRKSSDVINDIMSDDEKVASLVPRGTCFSKDFWNFVENERRLFLFSYESLGLACGKNGHDVVCSS